MKMKVVHPGDGSGIFPDEIVEEILSRTPIKCVLRCRSVSKKWKALISTLLFGLLRQQKNRGLTLLVEERFPIYYKPSVTAVKKKRYTFVLPEKMGETETDDIIIGCNDNPACEWKEEDESESNMHMCCSSSGLVVLCSKTLGHAPFSTEFIIFNPLINHKVKIRVADHEAGQIYGVFFHPVLKEFCVLWGKGEPPSFFPNLKLPPMRDIENSSLVESYKLLNLGPSPSRWKDINNQSTARILSQHQQPRNRLSRGLGFFGAASPVVLDNVLYWMVDETIQTKWPNPRSCEETILAFDIVRGEFHLLPHPGPLPCHSYPPSINLDRFSDDLDSYYGYRRFLRVHRWMHLLEYKNHLSLFQSSGIRANDDDFTDDYKDVLCYSGGLTGRFSYGNNYAHGWLFNIWIFKREDDYIFNKGCWIKVHTIEHPPDPLLSMPPRFHVERVFDSSFNFKPIALINGGEVLVVQWEMVGRLFVYNLRQGTRCEFDTERKGGDIWWRPSNRYYGAFICAFEYSLIPITNSGL